MGDLRLLAVFAHPDDEAFGTGGTLSKYAAEGCDVYLLTATRGEAGQITLPDLATPASEITTVIDVGDFVEQKLHGMLCHATQVGADSRYATAPAEVQADHWFRHETFRLASSTVGWPPGVERDLFAALR